MRIRTGITRPQRQIAINEFARVRDFDEHLFDKTC